MDVRHEVIEIATPVVEALGFELVDVEFISAGRWIIRVTIDRLEGSAGTGPVSIDDCSRVSRRLDDGGRDLDDLVPHVHGPVSGQGKTLPRPAWRPGAPGSKPEEGTRGARGRGRQTKMSGRTAPLTARNLHPPRPRGQGGICGAFCRRQAHLRAASERVTPPYHSLV